MMNPKLEKLKEVLQVLNKDTITPKQLEGIIKILVTSVKEANMKSEAFTKEMKQALSMTVNYINKEHKEYSNKMKKDCSDMMMKCDQNSKKVLDKAIEALKEIKAITVKDGKDADEDIIVDKVIAKIKFPEVKEYILTGKNVVDVINNLPINEENQIDASHIKNLPERGVRGVGSFGVREAPKDGKQYARKNRDWVEVITGGGQVDTISAGTGISVNSTDPAKPIVTNTSPDQVVAITDSGVANVTGTYPNFNVDVPDQTYTLPIASGSTLGGVKVGTRLSIDGNGVLSADAQSGSGDVTGPTGAVENNFAAYDGITGKIIKDSGKNASDFMAAGSVTQYTDEMAQDAVGNAIGNGLDYDDSTGAISVDETELTTLQSKLTCVSKTANYTANPNELVNCDVSGGSFKVTLPSSPADKTVIFVKLNAIGVNKYLTIATSGTDKFNTPTGTVEIYMYLFGEYAQMQYCSVTGLWTTFISAATYNWANQNPGVDASTPISNADISIDTSTRVLTVTPPLGYFNIFSDGGGIITRYRKVGTINFPAFTNTSGMWYFYFDASGTAVTTQTPWTVADFPTIIPMYRVLWNATLYNFTITSGNVVEGATYTNNGQTFTIRQTYTGVTTIKTSGTGDPEASGTLTRATGTGDATLTFSAYSVAPRLVAQYVEYHVNDIPADTHMWFHLQGAQWMNGLTIATNALVTGTPNADGRNTVVALSTGSVTDDNLEYTVTNDATPTEAWQQDLGDITPATLNATNSALFTTFRQSAGGTVTFRDTTRFPFDWQQTTNVPNYITATGVRTPVADKEFFVYFIYATQNPTVGEPIKVVSATATFTTIANARAFNWTDIQNTYSILNDGEVRPLYRLIFEHRTSYNVGAKYSVLRETQDLRKAAVTSTTAATGSLPASSVTFVPYDGIGSTNVQSAISELADERLNLDQTTSQTIANGQPIQDTLTASELVATDASKKLSSLAVATYPSLTELSYVKGVTSGIQSQLNGKQASLGFTPEDVANKDTTITLGTSDTKYPSQNAVKVYVDNVLGNANALVYKGVIDCSGNPNYPAADAGHLYIVSVAGKIGGASGVDVEVGDMAICNTDSTVSGDQATVGIYWNIIQKNIIGAVTGPGSAVADDIAVFDSTTGKIIKDGGAKISDFVTKALYDANTILYATTDNTPIALTVGEQTVVGRTTGGAIAALAIDSDLSSVSANDDTIPSAKATKTALDLKAPLASPTFSGTITLGDNTRTDLTLPTADGYVTGPTTDSFASGYSSAAGDLVFFGSGGKWLEVDANAVATCKGLIGIALEAKTDTQAMKVALPGSMVRFDAWNWTVGATLYAGETLGAMQETIPTGADAIIKVVGFAVNADTIFFNPSPDQQSTVA